MDVGSIVYTVAIFDDLALDWGLVYPKKGDVLTVSEITKHPNEMVSNCGIVLLRFKEFPKLMGICDKDITGKPNFLELQLPEDIEELLKVPKQILIEK